MPYVRREYIKGKPQIKIARFSSGQYKDNFYEYKLELLTTEVYPNKAQRTRIGKTSCKQDYGKSGRYKFLFIPESLSSCAPEGK